MVHKPSLSIFHLPHQFGLKLQIGEENMFHKRTVFVELDEDGIRPLDVAHEMGHFLIAPKSRRYRKDYGIPTNVYRLGVEQGTWDFDEAKALLVEHFLLEKFGHPFKKNPLRTASGRFQVHANAARKWWRTEGKLSIIIQLACAGVV